MRVGYVLDRFPSRHQTFVLNEILALERLGLDISIYSLGTPLDVRHPSAKLRAGVTYAPAYKDVSGYLSASWGTFLADRSVLFGLGSRAVGSRRRSSVSGWLKGMAMAEAARTSGSEHLHAHFATGANVAAMTMARLIGVPFSLTTHAVGLYARPSLLSDTLDGAAFHATISDFNLRYVSDTFGADAARKTVVVRAAIDPTEFAVAGRESHDPPTILSVGRLVEKKGHDHLLEALALLRDRGHKFRAVVVGDGPERPRLDQLVRSLDLGGQVLLAGAAGIDEVRSLYAAADVYAMACVVAADGDRDGIPVSMMEAMAAGLPVVSTDVSGIPELVDARVGALVPAGNALALADALATLLQDTELRNRKGAAAAEVVAGEFDVDKSARKLLDLFGSAPR